MRLVKTLSRMPRMYCRMTHDTLTKPCVAQFINRYLEDKSIFYQVGNEAHQHNTKNLERIEQRMHAVEIEGHVANAHYN